MISNLVTFHSLFEDPWEGSMSYLLRRAGMQEAPIETADIIVFNGGSDIAAEIYNEEPIMRGVPATLSLRDKRELEVYDQYKNSPVLKLGICRGAQLLNCLNGGSLWQDVNNHGRDHIMTLVETGRKIPITSTHHQMMRPNWDKAHIIAVADEATYKAAMDAHFPQHSYPDDHKDMEILYYKDTNCLCIQGHPEYVPGLEFANYCIELINHYLKEAKCAA